VTLINVTTEASVSGAADVSGAFTLIIPISAGNNKLTLQATDPAGNTKTSTIIVRKGSGELAANLTASDYQIRSSALPEVIQLTVVVTDPDGRPLANADVTFTLAFNRVPPIVSNSLTTDSNGRAVFTTRIPKGAATGQGKIAVIIHTTDFGSTTDRTVITITK
jgi:protocatechuate 3,4-dioxygenase beta subunit